MVTSGDGGSDDLVPYLQQVISVGRGRETREVVQLVRPERFYRNEWTPQFENGSRTLILDVDQDHATEVVIVPGQSYLEGRRFIMGFALRVEDVDDPSRFVISDIVTVQDVPSLLFRGADSSGLVVFGA
jgi:hypothetical protein